MKGGNKVEITLFFKDADRELPKETGDYLCYINGEWIVLWYSSKHRLFNAYDTWGYREAVKNHIKVIYWAELPVF